MQDKKIVSYLFFVDAHISELIQFGFQCHLLFKSRRRLVWSRMEAFLHVAFECVCVLLLYRFGGVYVKNKK